MLQRWGGFLINQCHRLWRRAPGGGWTWKPSYFQSPFPSSLRCVLHHQLRVYLPRSEGFLNYVCRQALDRPICALLHSRRGGGQVEPDNTYGDDTLYLREHAFWVGLCSWWSFHLCFSGAIFQQPCKNLHSCRPHDMFLKFSPFYECLELSAFPFRALLLSGATPPFDTDSPWQHQAWQILAEIVGELSGTNSLISLYPVISWLETWKGRKVRESGKMEQDLCPLLSTPARAPQPRLGLLSGKYVTPLTSFDSEFPSGTKL